MMGLYLIRLDLNHNKLYGDKAYNRSGSKEMREHQNLTVLTQVNKANFIWLD